MAKSKMYRNFFFKRDEELDNEAFFNHDMIKALIVSFIVGIVFCFITTGRYVIYLSCIGTSFAAVIICYYRKVNFRNVTKLLLLVLSSIIGYFFVCYKVDCKEIWYCQNELQVVFLFVLMLVMMLIAVFWFLKEDVERKSENLGELFIQQKGDLKRLEEMVEQFRMVCVDAPWGQGKSFLMDHFREKNKDRYIFIRIKSLTYGVENIAQYVVNELFSVLEQNGILSFKFFLKNALALKNEHIGLFTSIFTDCNDTTYDFLKQVCSEVEKLDKKVVIDFEDIDRVTKFKILADILSVSDTITDKTITEKIKVMFECDITKLEDMVNGCVTNSQVNIDVNYASKYLEKYLLHSVHLTEISLGELMTNFAKRKEGVENYG